MSMRQLLNEHVVTAFLADQLDQFGRQVQSDRWKRNENWPLTAANFAEMAATAVHLLDRIEAAAARVQPPPPAWDEAAARPFVPVFQQWFAYATTVLGMARECKSHGHLIPGVAEFIHRYNISKLFATDFEVTAEQHRRWERGELQGRPIEEVMDELRGEAGAAGA